MRTICDDAIELDVPVEFLLREFVDVSANHGIRFDETQFWVIHRRLEYGPFDYEWSHDFRGLELTYQGAKYGEICSDCEIHADLKEFALPMRVVQVASLVSGCMLFGVTRGMSAWERQEHLQTTLASHGCGHFMNLADAD